MVENQQIEKVTFNIPTELKKRVVFLKNDMNISMSALYKEAIESYVRKKEIDRWEKATDIMSKEYEKNSQLKDWMEFEEDIYDYTSR